jgi:hypothetical protein
MRRKPLTWTALVGLGLACVVAVSAATALAARSTASPFELVLTGRYEPWPPGCSADAFDNRCWDVSVAGTFTSGAPFCESGTTEEDVHFRVGVRRYTCDDGSGSLTLKISNHANEYRTGAQGDWAIVEGSGRYENLRGRGVYVGELLSGDPANLFETPVVFRTRAHGFADADATSPSIAFTSASASKLRSSPELPAYRIRVAFSLWDDVEGNPVAYKLKVTQGRIEIASEKGTTASGSASVSLRIEPFRKGVRSVGVYVHASDPVGNEQFLSRSLKLPR